MNELANKWVPWYQPKLTKIFPCNNYSRLFYIHSKKIRLFLYFSNTERKISKTTTPTTTTVKKSENNINNKSSVIRRSDLRSSQRLSITSQSSSRVKSADAEKQVLLAGNKQRRNESGGINSNSRYKWFFLYCHSNSFLTFSKGTRQWPKIHVHRQ